MLVRALLPAAILFILLPGCGGGSPGTAVGASMDTADSPASGTTLAGQASEAGVDIPPDNFAFIVDVTLSDAAKRQIESSGEVVVVSATFFADPADDADPAAINEVGQVDLGRKDVEIAKAGQVAFDRGALRLDRLGDVQGAPQVNVNVYSGRHASDDNILGCGFFQDSITAAARAPVEISCQLLSEAVDGDS